MSSTSNWSDLVARAVSGVAMVAVGLGAIVAGGLWFAALIAVVCGVMIWELVRMLHPAAHSAALQLGFAGGAAVLAALYLPGGLALPLLLAPVMAGIALLKHNRALYLAFAAMIVLASFGMGKLRGDWGMEWLLWLVVTVVVTDVLGYFAGRFIGGPKFWPRVSPKKTWSGTVAGWIGAGIVGGICMIVLGANVQIIGVSVAVSMASQIGDISESAVKRKMGVKDSSNLIPGHGGLMDRFDGMLGAALFVLIAGQLIAFPPGIG